MALVLLKFSILLFNELSENAKNKPNFDSIREKENDYERMD